MSAVVVPSTAQAAWTDNATMETSLAEVFPGETVQCSYELRITEPEDFTSLRITAVSVLYEDWGNEFISTASIDVNTFPFTRTFTHTLHIPQALAPGPHTGYVTFYGTEGGGTPTTFVAPHQFVCVSEALDVDITANPGGGQAPVSIDLTAVARGGTAPYSGYNWDFGDGTTGTGETISHTFSQGGTYNVEVTIRDFYDRVVSGESTDIVITPPFQVTIEASATSGPSPLTVNLSATPRYGVAPYTYLWSFGNGVTSNESAPSYVYDGPDTYFANLTVTDNNGRVARSSNLKITVSAPLELKASISGSITSGLAPLSVTFTSALENATGDVSYNWTFGDGTYSEEETPVHIYTYPGIYDVHLNVTDSSSKTARSGDLEISVMSDTGMMVTITQRTSTGSSPLTVDFTCTVDNGTSPFFYKWNFGDGTSSTSKDPTHTFNGPDTYTVRLTVTDSASQVSISNDLTVVVGEPVLGPLSSEAWIWLGWGITILAVGIGALLLIRYKK